MIKYDINEIDYFYFEFSPLKENILKFEFVTKAIFHIR